jgi:hypothetical protein
MRTFVGPRTALLQAFYEGPGTCSILIERVRRLSRGTLSLTPAQVRGALRSLEQQRLVRSWVNITGSEHHRAPRYYEPTGEGILEAHVQRESLAGLLGFPRPPGPSPRERRAMAERLRRTAALSAATLRLRDAAGGYGRT